MTHQTFNSECFRAFPHLKEVAAEKFDYFGDEEPGSYIIFESVLVPEIESASSSEPEYLMRLMSFVEEVAKPGLGTCDDLVVIGLGERIASIPNESKIRAAAGPNTMVAIRKAERAAEKIRLHRDRSPIATLVRSILWPGKFKD
jgi:hypothetical protein